MLTDISGVSPILRDIRETKKAYFNFAFRYHKKDFKGLPIEKFRSALEAELGIVVDACYEPLNNCSLYVPHTKPSRHRLNETYWKEIDPKRFSLPVCERIFKEDSVCVHHKVLMGSRSDMDLIANAIKKIYTHAEELMD